MGLPGSPDTSISLLYVDDEPALLEIARLYLEKSDQFSVTTCESATDALNLLSTTSFDAIISDYQMPEMDGIRFLTRLRENGVDIPFIIFTGKGREEVVIQALNEGADFYLQKGGDPKAQFAELVNKVRYAVSKRRSEEALRESEERYRTVVEVQDEFICRFLPDGTHIFANDAYCRYFGFDCNGIVGRKFLPPIHPEDREKVSRLYGSLTPDQPSGSMKQRILGQDGRVLWQRLHTTAFFDNHGHPCEYQTVGHDITDLMERDAELRRVNDEFSAANEQLTAAEEELRHQVEELAAARQEIEANSEQLHLAMDAGEHGFWDWDLTTNNAYFSPRYYTMLGYEPDEFPAGFDSWLSLLHPEDAGTVVPHIEASVREMQPFEEEFRMRCKDGSWRWISGRGKAYRSASRGGPSRALGVHVDIDDRKRAELELRKKNEELAATNSRLAESRQEIQRLFSTMLDGFAHHEIICDENGRPVDYRFLAVNPAFERMTGLKSGDIIGKTVREVLPQTEAYWIETFGRVALFGEEITFEQYASEQDSYFLVNAFSPAKNQFACSFMDITDRVAALEAEKDARQALSVANEQLAAAEEELRSQYEELSVAEEELRSQLDEMTALQKALQRSEAGFRTLAETAPVGIALLGADGRPVYFSPKFVELFGYTHNDLVTVDDWFTSAYPEASLRELARKDWNDALDQAKCNGSETRTLEYPVRCKDGGIRQIEFRAARAGEQTVVLFADVTERKAAEDALLASRRELNLILDTMPVGVTYIDPDYRIRYSNHQSALSSDKQPHEVTGLHCYLVRHGRSTRCDDCIIEKAMETGQVEEGFRLLPGGKVFHLKGCPVYDAGGNLTGAIEFGMDVTEQQRIEDTLRESEEKYRTLFAIMEPGVFYQQADGSLVDANPSALKMLGISREELLDRDSNHPAWNIIREDGSRLAPEEHPSMVALRTGKPVRDTVVGIHNAVSDQYVWVSVDAIPLRRPDSADPYQVFVTMNDITGRKQTEDSLRESEEKYRIIAENTADNIWIYDMDFQLQYISPSVVNLKGFTVEESLGQSVLDMMTPESYAALLARLNEEMAREGRADPDRTVWFETEEYAKDGSVLKIENSARLLRDKEGRPVAILGISRDITGRKKVEDALRQANKQLKILSGITRHDINNKISVVLGYIELARARTDDPDLNHYLNEMGSAIDTVHSQIDFTRIYQDLGSTDPQWQHLDQLIRDLLIPKEITFFNHTEPVRIYADPLLKKVFSTLLDNSLRHGRNLQTITVRTIESDGGRAPGKGLWIIWEDDGGGIPPDEKEKIFQRGYGKNTGLGLFLAREVLAFTGIDIRETGEYGVGARFEIFVPEPDWKRDQEFPE